MQDFNINSNISHKIPKKKKKKKKRNLLVDKQLSNLCLFVSSKEFETELIKE